MPLPSDTLTPLFSQPKHTYLVTSSSPDHITAQRILHTLSSKQTKLMSKEFVSKPKHVRVVHRLFHSIRQLEPDPYLQSAPEILSKPNSWKPVSSKNWMEDSCDKNKVIKL